MNTRPPRSSGHLPFSYYVLISIFAIILVLVIGITIVDYLNAETIMAENERVLREQTENQLDTSFRTIDTGLKMFDDTLNRQMDQAFVLFMNEYNRTGQNPSQMDLPAVKEEIQRTIVTKLATHISAAEKNASDTLTPSSAMDLYLINSSGVVEYTTYAPDKGLDFKTSIPYFYEYLTKIRLSEGFFPDRVVQEATTGNLRKYAYMPTPDHQYVLELGLTESVFANERKQLKYSDAVKEIQQFNPYLKQVRTFTTAKRLVGNRSYVPGENLSSILDAVLTRRESMALPSEGGTTVKYLFIDLTDEDYAADMSLVLELTYDTTIIQAALQNLIIFHLLVAVFALLLASGFAFFVAKRLTSPIGDIVHDVDAIAKGDLDHSISPTVSSEFDELEQSINAMVEKLKGTIQRLQVSENNLRHQEERYRAVVESQSEFITRFQPDGTHIFVNEAYCRYFGVKCDDIIGRKFSPNIPPEDQQKVRGHFKSLTPRSPFATIEHRIIMPNGEIRWQQWNDRAIFDVANNLIEYQSVGRDITPRVLAEEELKKLYSELEQRVTERTSALAAANRELESFSYSVSHDLRSPLRAIDGYSRILLEEHNERLTSDDRRYLELVRKSAQQMALLIDALLNFSRMGRVDLNRIPLSPTTIAHEALEELTGEMKDRQVEVTIEDLPSCSADPSLLRQVYYNLLSNALKFTRQNDHALITVGFRRENEGTRTVYFVRD
ncbi:MAG: PAS domain S-box protein, partial [Methanomicrobiales archaeon]|nr:PAS domain S-box protein [Methanomicrobiales archaeon]